MWQMLIGPIASIIEKLIPDPQAQAQAKLKMMEMGQAGELAHLDADVRLALGQMDINKAEASSPSLFKGGWRPAVGWSCCFGLIYEFLARPLLPFFATLAGQDVPPLPPLDTATLMTLLMGMLGLGGMRSYERVAGKIPPGN